MKPRLVGYCCTCRHWRAYVAERPINHGQRRFGRCRLKILVDRPNAMCDRWQIAPDAAKK